MFARFFVLLVCLGFFPALQALTRDCSVTGFKLIGNSNGASPLYPVDPTCYPKIDAKFKIYNVPQKTPWNEDAVVSSCIEFQDAPTTTDGWFLQKIMNYEVKANPNGFTIKQFFGNFAYHADNQILYNDLCKKSKGLTGSQNIIPFCKTKDNRDARLEFWYNENTHVLKVRFDVALPYHYAYAITETLSSLDRIRAGFMNIYNPNWLTTALVKAAKQASHPSCFTGAMLQLGQSGAVVTCASAGVMTKADEAKEVQAEAAERKLRGAAATEAEDAERKLQAKGPTKGPIKIQAKGAVKVKGGGVNGVRTTLGGR